MITLILIVVYMAFIGIGFPNTIFGAAWPAIYEDLHLALADGNYVNILVSGCTALAGFFSACLVNKFGTAKVTFAGSCLIGISLLGFSVSGNLLCLCLCAIPLGLTTGVLDAALNNYVASHYKPMFTNLLHCAFGVGASLSLYVMSAMLEKSDWNAGYRKVAMVQFIISAFVLAILPAWKKMERNAEVEAEQEETLTLSLREMFRMPMVRLIWMICLATNVIEGVCSGWGSTFLVLSRDFTAEDAAMVVSAFTIGMTIGRFGSGLMAAKMSGWSIVYIGCGITLISLLMLSINSPIFLIVGFFLVGLGNGPIYPTMIQLTPIHFGSKISGSIIGAQVGFTYLGFMAGPAIFGYLAQHISTNLLPCYLILFYAMMIICIWKFQKAKHCKK